MSYEKAVESFKARGNRKLCSVSKEEQEAVVQLVKATWEQDKVGAGADARNLTHTNIQVYTV